MERVISRERRHYVTAIETCRSPLGMANNIYIDESRFWCALQQLLAIVEPCNDVPDDRDDLFGALLLIAHEARLGRRGAL